MDEGRLSIMEHGRISKMEKVKRYSSVYQLQSFYTVKWLGLILTLLAIVQGGWLLISNSNKVMRFEDLLRESHADITCYIGFGLLTIVLLTQMMRQYNRSNADITYWRLPIKLLTIQNVKILHTLCIYLIYLAVQFFLLLLWYWIYWMQMDSSLRIVHGFFLSMIRSEFLTHVYPVYDPLSIATNLCFLLFMAVNIECVQCMYQFGKEKVVAFAGGVLLTVVTFYMKDVRLYWLRIVVYLWIMVWNYINMKVTLTKEGR